jgi:phosphoribosylaminoimidazole-succinocarboxamide synthase
VVTPDEVPQVRGRSMLVKRLKPMPVEAVVRGYLAGSGWKEYQADQSPCAACRCPPGCQRQQAARAHLHARHQGRDGRARREHQLRAALAEMIGAELARQIRDTSIAICTSAGAPSR